MVTDGTRQAKGFAIQISLRLKNIPNLELGESSEFPASKILTDKSVHRYISINDKVGVEETADASPVKKAPRKPAASKKIPAVTAAEEPVPKKKRTSKKKSGSSHSTMEIMAIAQEAVPTQIVAASTGVSTTEEHIEQPAVEDNIPADQLVDEVAGENIGEGAADESVHEEPAGDVGARIDETTAEPAVANIAIVEVSTADDVDSIIQQVLLETAQSASAEDEQIEELDICGSDFASHSTITIDERQWFDLPYEDLIAKWNAEKKVTTPDDTDEEIEAGRAIGPVGRVQTEVSQPEYLLEEQADMEMSTADQSVDELIDADEARSLEDIILSIPADVPLPSAGVEITKIIFGQTIHIPGVAEGDLYKATLPTIHLEEKGKEPLQLKNPAKGMPHKEHYYRLKWAKLQQEDFSAKIEQVLTWAETDCTITALQRKSYILLKYREVLVRKILDSWKKNFVPGEGFSATDLKVIALLTDLHLFVLEELKKEVQAHGILWKRVCCSQIFEGSPRDRGAVIARTNTNTPSRCWIRTMMRVNGLWVIEPCADQWVKIPQPIISSEVPRKRQYDDTLPPVSKFFRLLKKRWADVCLEVVEFCASRRLLPVGSINFCRALAFVEPDSSFDYRQPTVFALRFSQFFILRSAPVFSNFFRQLLLFAFDTTDLAATVSSLPPVSIDLSAALADFQAILSKQINESQSGISSKLHKIEQGLRDSLRQQKDVFKNLFHGARQESRNIDNVQTLRFTEFRKNILSQNASIFTGLADVRKEAQANYLILTDQLGQLFDYINRGGNDKKGKSSSRGPQQPPNVQIRDSGTGGGSAERTPNFAQRVEMA
ncbi:tRNA(adenine(34)) deaminase, chloroplastic [Dorcoceras hygrometricum]|uniref:tRNA(Adenine(34)) deaminase, chloroplastic n=1 Tax=Dorcoceras hygrometricum TaxID=472368 RepID=A0A2Z7AUZ2_9LAMI|nr:tRNA(adenine(34)) deaminase, chloroplastic [Dorcoceras hygrometricum]